MFNEGRTNVHDEERSRRPSLITEDLKNRIDQHIKTNRIQVIFHLFTHLKQFWGGTRMGSDGEVKKTVKDWFNGLVVDFYGAGMQKLVT
jgi:hypothetical protein